MSAKKFDSGKPKMSLVDPAFVRGMAEVLDFGEQKYGEANWMEGMPWSKLYDSLQRHAHSIAEGEFTDPESGASHFAHAASCLMMLEWYITNKPEYNDMRFSGKEEEVLTLDSAQARIFRWADRIIPDRTPEDALKKLVYEEIPELLNGGIDDPLEWADVFILILDCAKLRGIDIVQAAHDKMAINEGREWEINKEGLLKHV